MRRGVVQAGKLEPGIRGRALLILRRQRGGVAALEILADGGAMGGIVDNDKAPGLTEPYRGGKTRELDQTLQCPRRQRVASKASNVPAPDKEVAQTRAEGLVEIHRLAGVRNGALDLRLHAPSLNVVTIPRARASAHVASALDKIIRRHLPPRQAGRRSRRSARAHPAHRRSGRRSASCITTPKIRTRPPRARAHKRLPPAQVR